MENLRLVNNVQQNRQANRYQSIWVAIAVVSIIALDIFIVADLLTGNGTPLSETQAETCHSSTAVRQTTTSTDNKCPIEEEKKKIHSSPGNTNQPGCFRAAVFENNRIDTPSEDFEKRIQSNLAVYDRVARIANQNGANMIVYPEDGIIMGSKRQVEPHLQQIPDPELLDDNNNNPCLQPEQFEPSIILKNLSCIARENKLYVIANFGTKENCDPPGSQVGDRKCPEKGFFALNTDVVLDPMGNFIKRYRKYNLFIEIFDHPPHLEEVYFDTPSFGRFGVFTCFDIVFERPAIELVEKHKVDTILFPTWWYDEIPMLTATLSQEAWSRANNVNLLAANMFRRNLGSIGSGIYTGNDTLYTTASSQNARLLIANVISKPKQATQCSFDPVSIEIDTGHPVDEYKMKSYELQKTDVIFTLEQMESKHTICNGPICCTIDYKIEENSQQQVDDSSNASILSRMVFIARDTNRLGVFKFYEQVCLLATLEKPLDLSRPLNETVYSREPLVSFKKLSISGTFQSSHVFPFAGHHMTKPIERKERQFKCSNDISSNSNSNSNSSSNGNEKLFRCEHSYLGNINPSEEGKELKEKKIYSFGLYGRMYDRDIMPEGWLW